MVLIIYESLYQKGGNLFGFSFHMCSFYCYFPVLPSSSPFSRNLTMTNWVGNQYKSYFFIIGIISSYSKHAVTRKKPNVFDRNILDWCKQHNTGIFALLFHRLSYIHQLSFKSISRHRVINVYDQRVCDTYK